MICPGCGKDIPDSAKFCPYCGDHFTAEQAAEENAAPAEYTVEDIVNEVASKPTEAPVQTEMPEEAPVAPVLEDVPVAEAAQAAQEVQSAAQAQYNQYIAPAAEVPAAPVAEKKFDFSAIIKNKTVLIGAAGVAALILLFVLFSVLAGSSSGGSYNVITTEYASFGTEDGVYIFYGDKQLDMIKADRHSVSVNDAETCAYVHTDDDELYHIAGAKKPQLVEEYENLQSIYFSDDGSTLAIVYYDDGVNVLDYYRNGKLTESVAECEERISVVLSPSGDTMLYRIYKNGKYELNAYSGGKTTEIGKGYNALSVSDGGKTAYVTKEGTLYYLKNLNEDKKEKLDSKFNGLEEVTIDGTGIMYRDDDGKTKAFMPSYKEPVTVSKSYIEMVYPENAIEKVESFDSFIAYSNNAIKRFERKGDEYKDEKILSANGINSYQISADGSEIVYVKKDKLYRVSTKGGKKEKLIAEDLESSYFYASTDLSKIYFKNDDEDLCCNSPKKVVIDENDMDDISIHDVTYSGVMIVEMDDELYYTDGGKLKQIKDMEDVSSVSVCGDVVFINMDDELWISSNGKSFKKTDIEFD